jgi:VIT1/CCC1 family predicted Fe2+/Mn2+ transporter
MAAGEYVSVKSQAESALAEIESERLELLNRPEAELAELIESYVSRGVPRPLATEFATAISADFEVALDIHTRDEIGINPNDLPSAWVAAFSSFGSFAVGALIPLLPYLLGLTSSVLALSQVLAVLALFACGAAVSRVTTRSWWYSGLRQASIGVAAGLLTYFLGTLVGSGIG